MRRFSLEYLVARFEGIDEKPTRDSLRAADRDLRALERWGLRIERADWRLAPEVMADGTSRSVEPGYTLHARDRLAYRYAGRVFASRRAITFDDYDSGNGTRVLYYSL